MATQICALAGVLIHCGFPTSFSQSSTRLRASILKRVSLFTNDQRAREFFTRLSAQFFFFFFRKLLSEKKSRARRTKHVHHRVFRFRFTRLNLAAIPRDPTCCQPPQRNTLTVSVVTCFVSWHFHRGYAPQIGEPWAESNEQLVIGTGQLPVQRTSAGIPFQSCALPAR